MVVSPLVKLQRQESGQSVLEFLFMLPVVIGLVVLLVRVNSAIQASIVNQKYVRSHMLFLTFNSPVYPRLSLQQDQFVAKGMNKMVVGMADQPVSETNNQAVAPTRSIVRNGVNVAEGGSGEEPEDRANVRIRTTATLCTPIFGLGQNIALTNATFGNDTLKSGTFLCMGKD